MKQTIRITLASVLVLALAVLGVGSASVIVAYNDALNSSATVLADGVKQVTNAGASLSSAVAYADSSCSMPAGIGRIWIPM